MKILILVMSSDVKEYPTLVAKQKETWDSISNLEASTVYYYASHKTKLVQQRLNIDVEEGHGYFYIKTMLAFKELLSLHWDYIFKTDNSAYINKEALVSIMRNKPRENYFGGHLYQTTYTGTDPFLWGEGMIMSRDVVKYLVDEYESSSVSRSGVEDVHIGMILKEPLDKKVQWDTSLKILEFYKDPLLINHAYRCKKESSKTDLQDQLIAMQTIHNYITNGQTNSSGIIPH